ncbi:MAG: hypothetical protein R3F48_02115 [Candidatus Zixiibacteriota bacterium]
MRARFLQVSIGICIVLCGLLLTQTAQALQFHADDRYTLIPSDTVRDDLYVTCGGVGLKFGSEDSSPGGAYIDGTVLGDMCLAGGSYHFTGEILGNFNTASQRANLRGKIHNSVRIAAQMVSLDAEIGKDAMIFASEIELGSSSSVGRDVSLMGNEVSINGDIGRDVYIFCDQVIISGNIGGDVKIEAQSVTIVGPAEIQGDIKYKGPREIKMDDDVIVHGEVDWDKTEKTKKEDEGSDIGLDIVLFFCSLTTGLILIPIFRQHTELTVQQIQINPLASLGIGFVFLFAAPFAILLLMFTIIGIPAALILLFAYTVFFYIAKIYTSIVLGELIIKAFRKNTPVRMGLAFVIGLIILSLLFNAPYIGWIVYVLTIFFGLGGLLRGMNQCRRKIKSADSPPPQEDALA